MAIGPEDEFKSSVGVIGFFGFEFADACPGEASASGAVIDLDSNFEFDHAAGLEDSGIACWDEGFRPEHDFAGASEILNGEDAERFSCFGHARFDRAYHASDGVALAWVFQFDFIDQTDTIEFI